jgi:hypothetical protein
VRWGTQVNGSGSGHLLAITGITTNKPVCQEVGSDNLVAEEDKSVMCGVLVGNTIMCEV